MNADLVLLLSSLLFTVSIIVFGRKRFLLFINNYRYNSELRMHSLEESLRKVSSELELREQMLKEKEFEMESAKKNTSVLIDNIKLNSDEAFAKKVRVEFESIKKEIDIMQNEKIEQVARQLNKDMVKFVSDKATEYKNDLHIKYIHNYLDADSVKH